MSAMPNLRDTQKVPDLVYDVGLNRGQDTDYYLKKGFRVVAFEADPGNVEFCRERFADAIADGSLTIVEGAICEPDINNSISGKTAFYRNDDHFLWGTTSQDFAHRNNIYGTTMERIAVDAVDFAAAMAKHGVPHYLKADIVGSETICLRAMLEFENKPDYISIRSEKVIFRNLLEEFDLLEQLGYHEFKAIKQDFEREYASLPTNNGPRLHEFEEGASGPFGEDTRGEWKSRSDVLKDYKRIFIKYWLFGDYSFLVQTDGGRKMIHTLERVLKRSVPGWYDTHARLDGSGR